MKKRLVLVLAIVMTLITIAPTSVEAAGFFFDGIGWRYLNNDGTFATDCRRVDNGFAMHFNALGYADLMGFDALRGEWKNTKKGKRYMFADGRIPVGGPWLLPDGQYYTFDDNGYLANGSSKSTTTSKSSSNSSSKTSKSTSKSSSNSKTRVKSSSSSEAEESTDNSTDKVTSATDSANGNTVETADNTTTEGTKTTTTKTTTAADGTTITTTTTETETQITAGFSDADTVSDSTVTQSDSRVPRAGGIQ